MGPKTLSRRAGKVGLVGRPNVGKSTLLNALLGERLAIVSPRSQTTRDRILGVLTRGRTQFAFLDSPGLHAPRTRLGHAMNKIVLGTVAEADVVVLVTDDRAGVGEIELQLLAACGAHPTVCALNKVDRVKDKGGLLPLLDRLGKVHDFAAIVPISARKGDGLDGLLAEVEKLLPEGEHPYGADTLTDRPVRFFVAEIVREQILDRAWEEVPHGVAVVVDAFDEDVHLTRITATIHVAKESHKRIIVGRRGAFLKAVGQAARQRCEALLGRKVHLGLWVRVTPDWFDRDAALREVGYDIGEDEP